MPNIARHVTLQELSEVIREVASRPSLVDVELDGDAKMLYDVLVSAQEETASLLSELGVDIREVDLYKLRIGLAATLLALDDRHVFAPYITCAVKGIAQVYADRLTHGASLDRTSLRRDLDLCTRVAILAATLFAGLREVEVFKILPEAYWSRLSRARLEIIESIFTRTAKLL